ncbi:MAG: hypothetical protein QOH60_5619 [Mycobacterium sp.]|nr:hypothetical protein [Mycobacterium sp.]
MIFGAAADCGGNPWHAWICVSRDAQHNNLIGRNLSIVTNSQILA